MKNQCIYVRKSIKYKRNFSITIEFYSIFQMKNVRLSKKNKCEKLNAGYRT